MDHIPGSATGHPRRSRRPGRTTHCCSGTGCWSGSRRSPRLALIAEASLLLPPGPASLPDAIASVLLLAGGRRGDRVRAVAPGAGLAHRDRPAALHRLDPVPDPGGRRLHSGVGIVLLSPLIWTALFHRRWESAVVSAAVLAVMLYYLADPDMAQPGRADPADDLLGGAGGHDRFRRARAARPDPPVPAARRRGCRTGCAR